jgi:hypothetical protein
MIWLSWRQFRIQAAAAGLAAIAVTVVLAITGPRLADLARRSTDIFDLLTRTDRFLFYAGIVLLAVAPAVIGAFWGAPMVARELETGTHRLVWNQTVTRSRWLATRLGLTVGAAALAMGAMTVAVTWWSGPLDGAVSNTRGGLPARLTPVSFGMRGLVPVAYTVFAIVLGVALGIVVRRSLPAMALTLAVVAFVQIASPLWIRPHLVPPVTVNVSLTERRLDSISLAGGSGPVSIALSTGNRRDWILSNTTVDAAGHEAHLPAWFTGCLPSPSPTPAPIVDGPVQARPVDTCLARLTGEGYRQRIVYQPADHFWRLQAAEAALFLLLSGLLTAFCFWFTRTRLS